MVSVEPVHGGRNVRATKADVQKAIDSVRATLKILDCLDVPDANEHLQSYATDGVYGAIRYLETLQRRLPESVCVSCKDCTIERLCVMHYRETTLEPPSAG